MYLIPPRNWPPWTILLTSATELIYDHPCEYRCWNNRIKHRLLRQSTKQLFRGREILMPRGFEIKPGIYTLKRCRPAHGHNISTLNDIEHQCGMKMVMQSRTHFALELPYRTCADWSDPLTPCRRQRIWPYDARNRSEDLMLSLNGYRTAILR